MGYKNCVFVCKFYILVIKNEGAKVVDQNEAIVDRLKKLKSKSGMTSAQIAEKSKIPESTITRIFSGKTGNPTITTVMAITKAMGGTAADVFDDTIRVDVVNEVPQVVNTPPVVESKSNEDILGIYKDIIKVKDKWIKTLFVCLCITVFVVFFILLYDITNGNIGYVRY